MSLIFSLRQVALLFIAASVLHAAEPLEAVYSAKPIVFDASLSDPVWKHAPRYPFLVTQRDNRPRFPLSEEGSVQLAWDDTHLYVAARLEDADLVAEDDADHAHHYRSGDVVEVFLRSGTRLCYWELYATPHGRKTVFFFPSRGRGFLPGNTEPSFDLKVAAKMEGTLNQWRDKDKGFTVVFSLPLEALRKEGGPLEPGGAEWRILVARYNYSAYHDVQGGELSTTSGQIMNANFHIHEDWRPLRLVK